jgi:DNA invertase Pin-like site-specific DNA recombinase
MDTMDGYVRVSRVLGREGEGYMSPAIQRDDIGRWAGDHGISVGMMVEEEDVSGGKAIADRRLGELIKRVEDGRSAGVIVRSLDRFGRDSLDGAVNIKRLTDVGARLIAVIDGVDTGPGGSSKIALAVQLAIAEDYLDRVRTNWDATKRRNVEVRGLHVCATPPIGYRRIDEVEWPDRPDNGLPVGQQPKEVRDAWKRRTLRDARLVVEPAEAEAVLTAFKMRAEGHTFAQVARAVTEALGRSISHTTVCRMIANRVYLGEAHAMVRARVGSGKERLVKEHAHPAIITPELFAAARRERNVRLVNDGTLSEQALLAGLVFCAGCGSKCWVKGKAGTAFYSCSKSKAGGCPAPASSYVKVVDEHVVWLLQEDASAVDAASSEEQRYLEARVRVQRGEADLSALVAERGDLSLEVWRKMVVAAEAELDAARAAMYELPDLDMGDDVVTLDGKFYAYAPWGEDKDADRRTLRRYVGSVSIRSVGMNRWVPISKRIEVRWIDGSEPRIPER